MGDWHKYDWHKYARIRNVPSEPHGGEYGIIQARFGPGPWQSCNHTIFMYKGSRDGNGLVLKFHGSSFERVSQEEWDTMRLLES